MLEDHFSIFTGSVFPSFQVKSGGWRSRWHSCWMRSVKSLRISANVSKRLVLVPLLIEYWLLAEPLWHNTGCFQLRQNYYIFLFPWPENGLNERMSSLSHVVIKKQKLSHRKAIEDSSKYEFKSWCCHVSKSLAGQIYFLIMFYL